MVYSGPLIRTSIHKISRLNVHQILELAGGWRFEAVLCTRLALIRLLLVLHRVVDYHLALLP